MGTGSFPGVKSVRGVTVTPHPLLLPWSWKGRAIPLLPIWAVRPVQSLSACTRVHFTLPQCLYKGWPLPLPYVQNVHLRPTVILRVPLQHRFQWKGHILGTATRRIPKQIATCIQGGRNVNIQKENQSSLEQDRTRHVMIMVIMMMMTMLTTIFLYQYIFQQMHFVI